VDPHPLVGKLPDEFLDLSRERGGRLDNVAMSVAGFRRVNHPAVDRHIAFLLFVPCAAHNKNSGFGPHRKERATARRAGRQAKERHKNTFLRMGVHVRQNPELAFTTKYARAAVINECVLLIGRFPSLLRRSTVICSTSGLSSGLAKVTKRRFENCPAEYKHFPISKVWAYQYNAAAFRREVCVSLREHPGPFGIRQAFGCFRQSHARNGLVHRECVQDF
jgi:hypothetical protein